MSEFNLSDGIDEDKIFLLNLSQLSTQWSPTFYHKERLRYLDIFLNSNYPFDIKRLSKVINISSKKSIASKVDKYIGMANIESNTGKYLSSENEKGKGDCSVFKKGNVLFGKLRPYLNKVYLAEFDGGCTTEFIVMDSFDKDIISNKFLSIFLLLDCVVNQTKHMMTGNTLPRLQTFDIENLIIPIPPKPIQQNIIDIMDKAYVSKKQKEQEAKELLESIDTYLLDELGITLPEVDNSLDKRIFEVNLSDVSSYRTDAEAYLPYYDKVYKAIGNTKYDLQYLNKVVFRVNRRFKAKTAEEYKYIQLGSIGIDSSEVIKPLNIRLPEIPSRAQQIVKTGEILFAIANPQWGTHILVKKENNNFIASSGFIILDSDENNNNYITEVLRSNLYKKLYEKYLTGSGLFLNISTKDLLSLKIPLPPIEKQNEIAEHIQAIRDNAKQLKLEAVQELESAKAEVEKMILGL